MTTSEIVKIIETLWLFLITGNNSDRKVGRYDLKQGFDNVNLFYISLSNME